MNSQCNRDRQREEIEGFKESKRREIEYFDKSNHA